MKSKKSSKTRKVKYVDNCRIRLFSNMISIEDSFIGLSSFSIRKELLLGYYISFKNESYFDYCKARNYTSSKDEKEWIKENSEDSFFVKQMSKEFINRITLCLDNSIMNRFKGFTKDDNVDINGNLFLDYWGIDEEEEFLKDIETLKKL